MRTLSPAENLLYAAGGLLIVLGAALPIFVAQFAWALGVFTAGVALFVPMQLRQSYEGTNYVVRRLRRQQLLGAFFLCVTALLMLSRLMLWRPFRADEWKVTLAVAAIFELWSAFRIPAELEKEKR